MAGEDLSKVGSLTSTGPLHLGELPTMTPTFTGKLDAVRIYRHARDHQQIARAAGRTPLRLLPPSSFSMGSPGTESCREKVGPGKETQHPVQLSRAFQIATTEVSQRQFQLANKHNPAKDKNCQADCPVETVTWSQAAAHCNALSAAAKLTPCYSCSGSGSKLSCVRAAGFIKDGVYRCPGYRLPTEAEWEYAYRAGSATALYNGAITTCQGADANASAIAWYKTTAGGPQPVAGKAANAWGLFDMAGNVDEWCHDHWLTDLGKTKVSDPWGTATGNSFATRGGSFANHPQLLRAASRIEAKVAQDYLGFRCARTACASTGQRFSHKNPPGWTYLGGTWNTIGAVLHQANNTNPTVTLPHLALYSSQAFADVAASASFTAMGSITTGKSAAGVVYRHVDAKNYYWARINPAATSGYPLQLWVVKNGVYTVLASSARGMLKAHRLRVEARGSEHLVFVDDELLLAASDSSHPAGLVGLATFRMAATFDDVDLHCLGQPAGHADILRGLVAHWPLDGNAKNSVPLGPDGTTAGVKGTKDRFGSAGKAYQFDGTAHIDFGPTTAILSKAGREWSYSLWYRSDDTSNNNTMFSDYDGSKGDSTYAVRLTFHNGLQASVRLADVGPNTLVPMTDTTNWRHAVVTVSLITREISLYLDGQLVSSHEVSPGTYFDGGKLRAGAAIYNGKLWGQYKGALDDLRVYDRVLSRADISALYGAGGWEGVSCAATGTITVTKPGKSSVYNHGQKNASVSWSGATGSAVTVWLRRGGEVVSLFQGKTTMKSSVSRGAAIPSAWSAGSGYQLMVVDDKGAFGCSVPFSISP